MHRAACVGKHDDRKRAAESDVVYNKRRTAIVALLSATIAGLRKRSKFSSSSLRIEASKAANRCNFKIVANTQKLITYKESNLKQLRLCVVIVFLHRVSYLDYIDFILLSLIA